MSAGPEQIYKILADERQVDEFLSRRIQPTDAVSEPTKNRGAGCGNNTWLEHIHRNMLGEL